MTGKPLPWPPLTGSASTNVMLRRWSFVAVEVLGVVRSIVLVFDPSNFPIVKLLLLGRPLEGPVVAPAVANWRLVPLWRLGT